MSLQNKPIPPAQLARLRQFPCDGIPRFNVKGRGGNAHATYSEAYEAIFRQEGGSITGPKKQRVHTTGSIRRLILLNNSYLSAAPAFINTALQLQNIALAKLVERVEAPVTPEEAEQVKELAAELNKPEDVVEPTNGANPATPTP